MKISEGINLPYVLQHKNIFNEFKEYYKSKNPNDNEIIKSFIGMKYNLIDNAEIYSDMIGIRSKLKIELLGHEIFKAMYRQNQVGYSNGSIYSNTELELYDYLDLPNNDRIVLHYYSPANYTTCRELNFNEKQKLFVTNFRESVTSNRKRLEYILFNKYENIFLLYLLGDNPDANLFHFMKILNGEKKVNYQKHKEIHLLLLWHHIQNFKKMIGPSKYGRLVYELKQVVSSYLSDIYQFDSLDNYRYNGRINSSWKNLTIRVQNAKKRQSDYSYDKTIKSVFARLDKYLPDDKDLYSNYNVIIMPEVLELLMSEK